MKKMINTKKVVVAALILTLALLISPFNSIAKGGHGAIVIRNEGPIQGLEFGFKEPLPVDLGGFSFEVTDVVVLASGREITVLTPRGQYIYHAQLESGENDMIFAYTTDTEFPLLLFAFDSARLFEKFQIVENIPQTPEELENYVIPEDLDVNLFFKVKDALLIDGEGNPLPGAEPFNLMFKIKRGELKFIYIW